MGEVVNHTGKVVSVSQEEVVVQIERGGACSGCSNKKACQFGEAKDHIVAIKTQSAASYTEGEEILVSMKGSLGLKAVLYAYLLPLLLLVTTLIVFRLFIDSEALQILFALIPVVVYYLTLYKVRNRLEKKFNFHISKL